MLLAVVMECLFSATFLQNICLLGVQPDAVFIAHPQPIPFEKTAPRINLIADGTRVDEYTHRLGLPLYRLYSWNAVPEQYLEQFDTIVVACFPRKLPAHRLKRRGIRAWNVHPSALPELRGPDPLFYTARGDAPSAVSIHEIDAQYDTGPLLKSVSVHTQGVCDEHEYIAAHAMRAAALYCQLVAQPVQPTAQPERIVSAWASYPTAADYTLSGTWSMTRTLRFVALTNLRAHPYWVPTAHAWVHRIGESGEIRIPCADGVLYGTRWHTLSTAQV